MIEEITKKILKKQYKLFQKTDETLMVFFEDKGKYKFGYLPKNYYLRYGANVAMSVSIGNNNPWFCSNEFANRVEPLLVELLKSGNFKNLPDVQISDFTSIRS